MMECEQVAVCGAGGFGREIAWLAESCSTPDRKIDVVCFIDDAAELVGMTLNEIRVVDLQTAGKLYPGARVVTAVGSPRTREAIVRRIEEAGLQFGTLIHPRVERSKWIEVGEGTVVCAGTILTTNIRLGRHVQINLGCTLGHDSVLDDYATLAPGAHVSGWVHLGRRCYVGTGAVIINGTVSAPLIIGDDVVIGAGACVTKSVPAGITVAGVPAKEIGRRS